MPQVIIANDLPYSLPTTDPKQALQDTIAFSANDWGESRAMAWVYGIVLGWDFDGDEDDDEDDGSELREEFRQKFGWTGEQIARLEALHAAFERLGAGEDTNRQEQR